jgi:uncharacterized membrane protein (UPF0127 family)
MNVGRRKFLMAAGLVAAVGAARKADAQGITFQKITLTITSSTGSNQFIVDVSTNASQTTLGLRYRHEIAPDGGLLILQSANAPSPISVSTDGEALPLDLLFVAYDGTIMEVHPWIPTDSGTPIVSTSPVSAALELAGGTTVRYGILAGDKVVGGGLAEDRLSKSPNTSSQVASVAYRLRRALSSGDYQKSNGQYNRLLSGRRPRWLPPRNELTKFGCSQ